MPFQQRREEIWRWPTQLPDSISLSRLLVTAPEETARLPEEHVRERREEAKRLRALGRRKEARAITEEVARISRTLKLMPYERKLRELARAEGEIAKTVAEKMKLEKRDRVEIRPLSNQDVANLQMFMRSPRVLGETRRVPHYGRSIGWLMQAARRSSHPWLVTINDGVDGYFLITTKEVNAPPFVILSPEGKPRLMAHYVREVAGHLAEASRDRVIVKKANPFLELRLKDIGFEDYRKEDEWDGKLPRDDEAYDSPLMSLEHLFKEPSPYLKNKLAKFGRDLLPGMLVQVEHYNPNQHKDDAQKILEQWAPQMHLRTGETPQTAIEAHQGYLRQHSTDSHPMFMAYLRYTDEKGNILRIPFGFAAYEQIGHFSPHLVQELKSEKLERGHPFRATLSQLLRAFGSPEKSEKETPEQYQSRVAARPVYTMLATIAPTHFELPPELRHQVVRNASAALIFHSLQKLFKTHKNNERAIISLGGSETAGLWRFKQELGPVGWWRHHHWLLYPEGWQPKRKQPVS